MVLYHDFGVVMNVNDILKFQQQLYYMKMSVNSLAANSGTASITIVCCLRSELKGMINCR